MNPAFITAFGEQQQPESREDPGEAEGKDHHQTQCRDHAAYAGPRTVTEDHAEHGDHGDHVAHAVAE